MSTETLDPRPLASETSEEKLKLRTPRSISLRYVRWSSHLKASSSCEIFRSLRALRMFRPRARSSFFISSTAEDLPLQLQHVFCQTLVSIILWFNSRGAVGAAAIVSKHQNLRELGGSSDSCRLKMRGCAEGE